LEANPSFPQLGAANPGAVIATVQNLLGLGGALVSELTGLAEFTGKSKARGFGGEWSVGAGTEPFSHLGSEQQVEGCLLESWVSKVRLCHLFQRLWLAWQLFQAGSCS